MRYIPGFIGASAGCGVGDFVGVFDGGFESDLDVVLQDIFDWLLVGDFDGWLVENVLKFTFILVSILHNITITYSLDIKNSYISTIVIYFNF